MMKIQQIKCIDRLPTEENSLKQLFSQVDIITTAVGVTTLPKIAMFIANIINHRFYQKITKYLNIIACENAIRATSILQNEVMKLLDEDVIFLVKKLYCFC